jgi:YegS/Rv2252/BmrU family lipid kinase
MRLLVVINPASSRGDTSGAEARIRDAFGARRLAFDIVRTEHAGHAKQLVAENGREFDGFVAVGGDGTLHEVLQAVDVERHVVGLIPRGSGNDFAWMNGWPASVDGCAARIASRQERRIDLGLWDGGRFHTSVGVGFEAQVNYESHRIRHLRGTAIYLAALARTLHDLRTYPVRIDWVGGSWEGDMLLASIGNGSRVGGAFYLTPEARNDDGLLDICFTPRVRFLKLLTILPRTFRGSHVRTRPVEMRRGARIRIESRDSGFPVHVDGEMIGLDVRELDLRVAPRALRTF